MNPSISSVREVEVECSDQALWEGHSSLLIHYYDAASLLRCSIPGDLFLFSLLEFISLRNPWEFPDLGFFDEGDLPWAISLTDLRVISELVEFPSQFIHYLTRRLRINEHGHVQGYDELDWFGTYLHDGLYFEDTLNDKDAPEMIFLQSATTNFDDYYFYVTGQRKTPVPKPTQPMPETMRKMLTELESYRPLRYLDIACAFLDMSFTTREDFVNTFVQQRQRTLQDQQLHDSTFHFEHKD